MRLPESIPRTTSLDCVSELLSKVPRCSNSRGGVGLGGLGLGGGGTGGGAGKGGRGKGGGLGEGVQGWEGLAAEAWEDGGWASVVRADWAADGGR